MRFSSVLVGSALHVLLLLFVSPTLSAQNPDPSLRLREGADSTTGGAPSVMIRRLTKEDWFDKHRHVLTIDPIKFAYHINLAYYYTLNHYLSVGGGVDFTPGLLGDNSYYSGVGGRIDGRVFPGGNAPDGFYFRTAATLFSGTEVLGVDASKDEAEKFTMTTVQLDIGWRAIYDRVAYDFMIGYERFLSKADILPTSESMFEPTFLSLSSDADNMIHCTIGIGYSF